MCFLDKVEVQFLCGLKKELLVSFCLLKHYFLRLSARLLFKSFQDLDFREIFPVLTDICAVLFVNVYALFVLNGGLTLITLNKQTNITFENLKEAFTCFILCDVIFSSKVCFVDMSLGLLSVGRISDFFECYIKISQSLNYFGIFITDKEKSVSHLSPGILPKKQYDQSSNSTCVVFFSKNARHIYSFDATPWN